MSDLADLDDAGFLEAIRSDGSFEDRVRELVREWRREWESKTNLYGSATELPQVDDFIAWARANTSILAPVDIRGDDQENPQ